jgi:hypothetical protein
VDFLAEVSFETFDRIVRQKDVDALVAIDLLACERVCVGW